MEKKLEHENNLEDFTTLSLYVGKVIELLNKNIIDYQSESKNNIINFSVKSINQIHE